MTTGAVPNGIDSEVAKWFARAVIPVVVAVSLGIFSWNATRAINTLDLHSAKLEQIGEQLVGIDGKVSLFQQFLALMKRQSEIDIKAMRDSESDHELRLRQLEKKG